MTSTRVELECCVAACVYLENGSNIHHVDLPVSDFTYIPAKSVIGAAKEFGECDVVLAKNWATNQKVNVTAVEISNLINFVPTSTNFINYLTQLKKAIYHEKIQALKNEVKAKAANAESLLDLSRELAEKEAAYVSRYLEVEIDSGMSEACANLIDKIENRIGNDNLLPTGCSLLDELHGGGLLPNEVVIVGARPSVGKTAFALQICSDCGEIVVLFSLEMSKDQIAPRLLASTALRNTKIATRTPDSVPEAIRNDLLQSSNDLMETAERIKVYDSHDQTIESIRRNARKEVENGAKLILIDYLQLLDLPKAFSRERAVAQISREIKNMSKELNVPVIILAQLNRACESEKRQPKLRDLRESGAIEQDANSVIFLHDTQVKNDAGFPIIAIIAEKGRDVGRGFKKAIFNTDHQRFYKFQEDF